LQVHGPLSFFNIGDNFAEDKYKVLFVGKNTYYNDNNDFNNLKHYPNSTFWDCRADGREMFENQSYFWLRFREIIQLLYPQDNVGEPAKWNFDKLWSRIALTNLTKCNTSTDSLDTTPYCFTKHCVDFFEEEVKILNPKHLVLFTSMGYDPYVEQLHYVLVGERILRQQR
jgi:hypothetical protein